MLEKLPPPIFDLIAPMWVWVLSLVGAAVGYLESFKFEDGWKVWLLKALTKSASSALSALMTYHMLIALDITDQSKQVVLIGIASHMGVEALKAFGEAWKSKIKV